MSRRYGLLLYGRRAAALLAASALSGCASVRIPPPPMSASEMPAALEEDSVIDVPIEVNTLALAQQIRSKFGNPVVEDRTPPISARLLTSKTSQSRVLVRRQIEPARAGFWTVRYRREQRVLKESYREYVGPGEWKERTRDVVRTVLVPFQQWVKPARAKFEYAWQFASAVIEQAYSTAVWINYRVDLTQFDIEMHGADLAASGEAVVRLSLDYGRDDVPLSKTVKRKGLLNGDVTAVFSVEASVAIDDDLKLVITAPPDGASIELKDANFPTSVAGIDFSDFTRKQIIALTDTFRGPINEVINDKFSEALALSEDKLTFGDQVRDFVSKNSGPWQVQDNLWLIANPIRMTISQPVGSGDGPANKISFNAAVVARPVLRYSMTEPAATHNFFEITSEQLTGGINVYPLFSAEYAAIAPKLRDLVNEYLNETQPNLEYRVGAVTIYPSDRRLVVGIQAVDNAGAEFFTAYLWGEPNLNDATSTVELKNADFTIESRNALVRAAAWFLDPAIAKKIDEYSTFSYAEARDALFATIDNLDTQREFGTLSLDIDAINARGFWLRNEDVAVQAFGSGHAEILSNEAASALPEDSLTRAAELGSVMELSDLHEQLKKRLPKAPPDAQERSAPQLDFSPELRALESAIGGDEAEKVIPIETARELGIVDVDDQIVIASSEALIEKFGIAPETDDPDQIGVARSVGDIIFEVGPDGEVVETAASLSDIVIPREEMLVELPGGLIQRVRVSGTE